MATLPIAHTGGGDVTTAASNSGASIVIDRPLNTAAGDLLVCAVFHQLSGGTLTRPAGWLPCGPSGGTVGTYSAFCRPVAAVGNEPSSYTWTNTGGARAVAIMFRVTGANLAAPVDAFSTVSTVGTVAVTAPGLTTTQDNCLLVAAWVASRGAGLDPTAITPPDPMISVGTVTAAPSSSSTMRVAVTPRGDSGAVSSKTATIQPTASSATAFMVAIAPAPATTPTVALPGVRLEVAFTEDSNVAGLALDDPSRGLLDTAVLGGGLTTAPVWTDVTAWLRSVQLGHGSTRVDSPVVTYEPGTLTAVLDNTDRRFDPANTTGPYTQAGTSPDGSQVVLNTNTGFEDGTTGWFAGGGTFSAATDQAFSGTTSGKLVPGGVSAFADILADAVSVEAGQTYRLSARVRMAVARTVQIGIHWHDIGGVEISGSFSGLLNVGAGAWALLRLHVTAPVGAVTAILDITMDGTPPADHVMWVDEGTVTHLPFGRVSQVTAMRAVRVLATWGGVTYELWRGSADLWDVSWTPGSSYSECTLTATDATKALSAADRTALAVPVGGGEDAGARVTRILDSAGWPAGDRSITAGDSRVIETDLAGDAWAELQAVAATELGELYVDGGGRVVFRNRRALMTDARSNTSQGAFGDESGELPIDELGLASDNATFFNDVRASRNGGVEQVAEDEASIESSYRKTYRPGGDLLLGTDAEVLGYVQALLHTAARPELRFTELTLSPPQAAELWPHALARRIGDRITVTRRPPGGGDPITRDQFIRGVRHDFTDEKWTTTWTLQDAGRVGSWFVLDDPELGVLDAGNALTF